MLAAVLFSLLFAMPVTVRALLQQAGADLQRGAFTEARANARKALALTPGSADAELILGLADTAEGDLPSAAQHFQTAAAFQPRDYRTYAYLGSTYLRQNQLNQARSSFRTVLLLNPGNVTALYNLGLIAMLERNPAAAAAQFAGVLRLQPSDAAALTGLLESQLQLRQFSRAEETARKLNPLLSPNSPQLSQIGATLAQSGLHRAALPILRRFAGSNPQSFEARYNVALALQRTGANDEAAVELTAILRTMPRAEAYNLLGSVEEARGRWTEALTAFQKASELDTGSEDFLVDYGSALVQAGEIGKAANAFERAAANWPGSVRPILGKASVYYLAGQQEQCARTLLDAIVRQPGRAPLYNLLGKTFEAVPSLQADIKTAFQKYLVSEPNDAQAYAHFGTMVYLDTQEADAVRFALAKRYLQRALTLNPDLPEAHLQLGIVRQGEGSLQEALASYKRAVALAPTSAAARYRLGVTYNKLGDAAHGAAELALYQKLKSSDAERERASVLRSVSAASK